MGDLGKLIVASWAKSGPKYNKSPNLVTRFASDKERERERERVAQSERERDILLLLSFF